MSQVLHIDTTRSDVPERFRLDGQWYGVRALWNAPGQAWHLYLTASDGTDLLIGKAIRVGVDMLSQHVGASLPPGALVAVDTTGRGIDPGRTELGGRVVLVYVTAEELAEARAA